MKKTLLAAALAASFAGSAMAASVELYGLVDTGLAYTNTSFGGLATAGKDTDSFAMRTGINAASRFGFKGVEELGDGYSVEFQLENGFDSDTGKLHTDKTLFDREARLSLNTPYGTVSFGRMGSLTSGAGTYDVFQATGDAMDGGYLDNMASNVWFARDRYDNMMTFATPDFNGLKGYVQYSFNIEGQEAAGTRDNDRYVAAGATYTYGPLSLALVYDSVMYNHWQDGVRSSTADLDDSQTVSFGVNYDFGVTKAFFGAQYGKNETLDLSTILNDDNAEANVKGYNLHIGAATPLSCGTLTVSAYYGDYEEVGNNNVTAKKYGIGLMHEYPLSKRTTFYTGAGFAQFDVKNDANDTAARQKGVNVTLGLNHKF